MLVEDVDVTGVVGDGDRVGDMFEDEEGNDVGDLVSGERVVLDRDDAEIKGGCVCSDETEGVGDDAGLSISVSVYEAVDGEGLSSPKVADAAEFTGVGVPRRPDEDWIVEFSMTAKKSASPKLPWAQLPSVFPATMTRPSHPPPTASILSSSVPFWASAGERLNYSYYGDTLLIFSIGNIFVPHLDKEGEARK